MNEKLLNHIVTKAAVNEGRATVRETYITVAEILDKFASGLSANDILGDYPPLSHLGLQAALAYAAHVVREVDDQAVAARPVDEAAGDEDSGLAVLTDES
jgi:uncharacterized protein (DUF433 family)